MYNLLCRLRLTNFVVSGLAGVNFRERLRPPAPRSLASLRPRPRGPVGVAQAGAGPAPPTRWACPRVFVGPAHAPNWAWPRPSPCRPELGSCCRRSRRSVPMASVFLARARGPLCRGECARGASGPVTGRRSWRPVLLWPTADEWATPSGCARPLS